MGWIKHLKQYPDIVLVLSTGAVALGLSYIPQLISLRWIVGFAFVFLGSGFSITRLLPKDASLIERLVSSAVVSLLLTYPASVLIVALEGQSSEAIFRKHLPTSLVSLLILALLTTFWVAKQKTKKATEDKFPKLLFIPMMIYALLTFTNLNRADVFGDEYDLGYQAYNLVDGIVAGRKAYLVSMSPHPPLSITIKHFSMNILESGGLDALSDWQFRVSEAVVGLLTIVAAYELAKGLYSGKTAIIAVFLLSVNNYMVWMGRIFHREMYLTFFMTAALFFYLKARKSKLKIYSFLAGLGLGASLLVKETAVILLAIPVFDLLVKKKQKIASKTIAIAMLIFSPVVAYNLAAFLRTGYADVFFSNLFGIPHPLTTPLRSQPLANTISLLSFLSDIHSPLIFAILSLAFLFEASRRRLPLPLAIWLITSILFFSLTSIRAYYFLFLTVPLMLVTANFISNLPGKIAYILMGAMVSYSLFYSMNTNIARDYSVVNQIGRIDGSLTVPHSFTRHFSLAARSWSEEVGYKRLQLALDKIIKKQDCLIVSDGFDSLAARRYLLRKDQVKEHYLGPDYPTRYPRCPKQGTVSGTMYLVSQDRGSETDELVRVVTDHLGNQRFYLFALERGMNL